jgi:hypothetical protein
VNHKINNSLSFEIIEPSNSNAEAVGNIAATMLGAAMVEKRSPSDVELERKKAVEQLQELGLLIPIENLELYHGRADTVDGHNAWKIDPNFETSRFNAHNVTSIYASQQKKDAEDFAYKRGLEMVRSRQYDLLAQDIAQEDGENVRERMFERAMKRWTKNPVSRSSSHNLKTGEVVWHETPIPQPERESFGSGPLTDEELRSEAYSRQIEMTEDEQKALWRRAAEGFHVFVEKIIARDRESSLIDLDFYFSQELSLEQRATLNNCLRSMLHEVTPLDGFTDEELSLLRQAEALVNEFVAGRDLETLAESRKISEQEIDKLAEDSGLPKDYVYAYAAVLNAKQLLVQSPAQAVNLFVKTRQAFTYESYAKQDVPIAAFYIGDFCKRNKIIGAKVHLDSTTIDRTVETISLFDTEAIMATKLPKAK